MMILVLLFNSKDIYMFNIELRGFISEEKILIFVKWK